MIIDSITNAQMYAAVGGRIRQGLEYLQRTNLAALEPGRYEIDGANVYVLVSEYVTKELADGRWEAHQRYLDLQCLVRGTERVGHAFIDRMRAGAYDAQKDVMWLAGDGDFATLQPGTFMLLGPQDAHMPGIAAGRPGPVKKVVVKIAV